MRDFTLGAYLDVLLLLGENRREVYGVANWLRASPKKGVLIRHDVDRRPMNALLMAKAEAELGVSTSYYFRTVGSSNAPEIMRAIENLGHEVGYHYEDLARARGNIGVAKASFSANLEYMRRIVTVDTVAMHGSPVSPFDNRDLWKHQTLLTHRLIGEAFLSVNYSDFYYLTDTGRRWGASRANLRDRPVIALEAPTSVQTTDDLLRFIQDGMFDKLALTVHPERWDQRVPGWVYQRCRDGLINAGKHFIALQRQETSRRGLAKCARRVEVSGTAL
jgi:hypothetical protein